MFDTFIETLSKTFLDSGFFVADWRTYVMILISCVLMYLAIKKQFEPLLLLPIAFGMLLANIPIGRPCFHRGNRPAALSVSGR